MFIYRGTKKVGKGVYWDPERSRTIRLDREDLLPGPMDALYYRLPHSYVLLLLLFIGLAVSMAFPYGIGVVLFFGTLATCWMIWKTARDGYTFFKKLFAESTFFSYSPRTQFFTGRKNKVKKEQKRNRKDER